MKLFPATWTILLLTTAVRGANVDFDTQIVPVLSKAGCNAAACHGGAAGRGGFRLSLFGGDPEFDFRSIVQELEGRRVNLANPQASLLLAKPLGRLEHGGGQRFGVDSLPARSLTEWIESGARRLRQHELERLEVSPSDFYAAQLPAEVPLRVRAHLRDGSVRDVGPLAVYTSNDESAVTISSEGLVTVHRGGRHVVLVRFGPLIEPLQVTAPLGPEPVDTTSATRLNWIDDEILTTLEELRLPPSQQCDDATFLRRISLDLTGRLPSPEVVEEFLADESTGKRADLIDALLESEEFVEFWAFRLVSLLRLRPPGNDREAAEALQAWLTAKLRADVGWDRIAQDLLTAAGDSHEVGPATYQRLANGAREQAEYVTETLMGVRMRCANCHNHPLDRWTQDDYHGLAQIFARIERGQVVRVSDRGEVTHPRTGEAAVPRIPGAYWLSDEQDGRAELAAWLTRADNPYFAHAMVGRIWKALLGRGLVEPADDLRATNPPTHPELFDRLAEDFIANGYSIHHAIGLICRSAAYARSSTPTTGNAVDDRFYSHALARGLDAEVLADAMGDVTGIYDEYGDAPSATRAISLVDPSLGAATLDILGGCDRLESCEGAAAGARGIAARLHLLNGPLLNRRLVHDEGRVQQMISAGRSSEEIIRESYLRALSRPPTSEELKYWLVVIDEADDGASRDQRLEDFVWSLLNCSEFTTNH